MVNFHKLLVPVDFSAPSKAALKYAADLVRGGDAQIVLLHVVMPDLPHDVLIPQGGWATPLPEVYEAARKELSDLEAMLGGVPCRTVLRTGDPGAEILAAAREEGVDVIVMSTHGRTGLARLLMGSTAEAVMRRAPVPVLTIQDAALAT